MVTLWVNSVFLSLLIANEGYIGDCSFPIQPTLFGVESSYSYVLLRFVGTSCGWWPRFYLVCHCAWPVGCLLMASSAASLCAFGMLTCCTCGCAPTVGWTKGFVAFLPVLRSTVCSESASYCGFSSPMWFITFAMGSPLRGRG